MRQVLDSVIIAPCVHRDVVRVSRLFLPADMGYHSLDPSIALVPHTVKTEIIGRHAKTLELPLLVRSVVSSEG